jgi:type IV secretory pathway TrbL component
MSPQVSQAMNDFLFELVRKKCMMGVFEIIIRFGAKKRIVVKSTADTFTMF